MLNKVEIENYIKEFSNDFDERFLKLIPKNNYFSKRLYEAILYVINVGGKRLRPLLLVEISKILGLGKSKSLRTAIAIELIHCYSLVHDDLPAMDNDDLRRGHPTCHKKFDDATAILVGDALQTLAFQILSHKKTHSDPEVRCNLITELANSSGINGMVGGQMLDLVAEKRKLNLEEIKLLQKLKTGELFKFCCIAGSILTKSNSIKTFRKYSEYLGLAFQIKDDLLDIEGDEKQIGKKTNKDKTRGKETFISTLGSKDAKKKCITLIDSAKALLKPFGNKASRLILITDYIISRNK